VGVRHDPIELVEAGYSSVESDAEWLRRVMAAARPVLDAGQGVIGFFFDRRLASDRCVWGAQTAGADEKFARAVPSLYAAMPTEARSDLLSGAVPITTTSSFFARSAGPPPEFLVDAARMLGFRDSMGIAICDASGRGCILGVPLPEPRRIAAGMLRRWSRVSAHLAAGLRLHRALEATDADAITEAVLGPDGKLRDASGPARERTARDRLRDAVLAMERARGPLRRRDEGLALWPALVEGRWSLVDRFESNGRRYIVAVKNDIELADPRAFAPRERMIAGYLALGRSNKRIAYELGIAEGTVGVLVGRVARKCGIRSRAALVRFLNQCANGEATVASLPRASIDVAVVHHRDVVTARLSPREADVARAIADGLSNEAIAKRLALSTKTIANAVARVFRKLGVGSRAEVARQL
jgi:DNA-binding NarL/FixJ family response regulator